MLCPTQSSRGRRLPPRPALWAETRGRDELPGRRAHKPDRTASSLAPNENSPQQTSSQAQKPLRCAPGRAGLTPLTGSSGSRPADRAGPALPAGLPGGSARSSPPVQLSSPAAATHPRRDQDSAEPPPSANLPRRPARTPAARRSPDPPPPPRRRRDAASRTAAAGPAPPPPVTKWRRFLQAAPGERPAEAGAGTAAGPSRGAVSRWAGTPGLTGPVRPHRWAEPRHSLPPAAFPGEGRGAGAGGPAYSSWEGKSAPPGDVTAERSRVRGD